MAKSPQRNLKSGLKGAPEPIAALNRIPILEKNIAWESREPLIDIRDKCPNLILAEHICPYLRSKVVDMLNRAQNSLPRDYKLKVGTALRTLSMQSNGWDNYFARMEKENPEWPLSALRRATNHFFAPYDQPAPPGHCTGGAVDVSLLDPEGNVIDLTAPTTGWEAAYTWSDKINAEAKHHRMMMVNAMLGAGFSNCRDEYWHYSYGDSAWAVRVGEKSCPYGWAHPPVEIHITESQNAAKIHISKCEHRFDGKVISGISEISIPDILSPWRVEICWASGVPVTLQIHMKDKLPGAIWWGVEKDEEENPFPKLGSTDAGSELNFWSQPSDEIITIRVVPASDRIFFSNVQIPPVESAS